MKHSDGLLIIDTKSDLMPTCQWKTILMHFFGNESDICDWTNEIWSEGKKSWKFREKKKAASYNFNWKKGNLTQKGGWGGKGKTILLISHTLRVVIRLKMSIMGLKRTFYIPFILSYLSFHVIFNCCGFRSKTSSIWFDVSCIEISPRLSTWTPSPWIRHWWASKLKF